MSNNRRHFLAAGAATAAVGALAWSAKSYAKIVGANDRIRCGFIGSGVQGNAHLDAYNELKDKDNLEAVGVADCWETRAKQGQAKIGAAKAFTDYRKLLEEKFDYITIATPEHWHCQMALDAFDAGLAIYCEKPLTHTIEQALRVVNKQKECGLPLQVGVQAMSDDSYSSAAQAIAEGELGQVVQAQIEYVRRYNIEAGPWREPEQVNAHRQKPDDLNWKDWLGNAPAIDWNPNHYFEWRCYSAYSGGVATDLFIHRITRIMKACNLLYPRRVVGMGGIWQWNDGRDLPDNLEMICEYPRGMTVYVLGTMSNRVGVDHLIRGHRATLQFTPEGWVIKDKDGKILRSHRKTGGEDHILHHHNLHQHLRDNSVALNCTADLGLAGVVATNMANESWRSGRVMGWDAEKMNMVPADTLKLSHTPEKV